MTSSSYAVKFKRDNVLLLNQRLIARAAAETCVYSHYPGVYMDVYTAYIHESLPFLPLLLSPLTYNTNLGR